MTLTRKDTAFLKGFAILLIIVHNFCHWLPLSIIENEYTFELGRIWKYVHYLEAGRPRVVLNFFAHFGHYGVPLFLFLSGYGLVMKYEREGAPSIPIGRFMWSHAVKLWKLLVPAMILFLAGDLLLRGSIEHSWQNLALMVSYVANLLPTGNMILGPWWFFSLIMQCYLIYRVLWQPCRSPWILWGTVAASLAVQAVLYVTDFRFECFTVGGAPRMVYALEYVRYNALGHLLPFALGIGMARGAWQFSPLTVMMAGILLTIASAFSIWLWFFSPLFAVMAMLPLATLVREGGLRNFLTWVGPISAAIFAFHPIVRRHLIDAARQAARIDQPTLVYGEILLYVLITLILAWIYTQLMLRIGTRSK